METILKDGGEIVLEFDVVEGSHIFIRTKNGVQPVDAFLEWGDVPAEVREAGLQAAERLQAAFKDCSSASAAVMECHARLEQEAVRAKLFTRLKGGIRHSLRRTLWRTL